MRVGDKLGYRARIDNLVDLPVPPSEGDQEHGDGYGGYVCFSCDRSVKHGEPFVCVSRLWLKSDTSDAPWQMIDAIASLQTCIECTLRASKQRLTWKFLPNLADMEICGFYVYAGFLGQATSRKLSDQRVDHGLAERLLACEGPPDLLESSELSHTGGEHRRQAIHFLGVGQCHHCCESINFTLPRMLIEIEVTTPMRSSMKISDVFRVGECCNSCSKVLFPIRPDGRMDLDIL